MIKIILNLPYFFMLFPNSYLFVKYLWNMTIITICESCQLAKIHRFPFERSTSRTIKPFDLIHADIWGATPIVFVNGARYFLLLVDDFSRFSWLYLLETKDEALLMFQRFQAMVERPFDTKVQCVRFNGEWVPGFLELFSYKWSSSSSLLSLYSSEKWKMWNQGLVNLSFDDNKTRFRTNDYISSVFRQDDFQSDIHKDKSSQGEIMKKNTTSKEVFFKTQAS